MKHFNFKKRCRICHEVVEPGYEYMQVPEKDAYICRECADNLTGAEFLELIEAAELSAGDLMDIFDIEFMEETDEYE